MFQNQVVDRLVVLDEPTVISNAYDVLYHTYSTRGGSGSANIRLLLRELNDIPADFLCSFQFSGITPTVFPSSLVGLICGVSANPALGFSSLFTARVPVTVTPHDSGSIVSCRELVNVPKLEVPDGQKFYVGFNLGSTVHFSSFCSGIHPYLQDVQSFNPLK